MRLVCTLMAGVVALAMAGCIEIPMLRPATGEQLEHWVAQEEYGKALHALDRISPRDPAYAGLQEQRSRDHDCHEQHDDNPYWKLHPGVTFSLW